jgi:hypothetical protein
MFVFQSCNTNVASENDNIITHEQFENNKYNTDFNDMSVAISKAIKSNSDFRKIIKEEALLMVDGDYDVLLKSVINKKLTPNALYKSATNNFTVKNLLESSFSSSNQSSLKKSSSSIIDELIEEYPDMQIAVPVHAETWDEENYIPIVAFIPHEFDVTTATTITGYDSEGNMVAVDAIKEPDDPVIIVSENERSLAVIEDPIIPIEFLSPTNLTGTPTAYGIRLTWDMSTDATPENITGYYVYRKVPTSSTFELVQIIPGVYNRVYDDNYVEANASYSYYVMSYYQIFTSLPSNYIVVTAPSYPNPVISFDAIQNALSEIELRWINDNTQYITSTRIYKHVVGVTSDYELFGTYNNNTSSSFDLNVNMGKKMIYKINHVSPIGESNPKYDFVQAPYRDISQNSPVYIKQIKFTDWSLEPWIYGKPEFSIIVTNVDQSTKQTYIVQENIDCQFAARIQYSQIFTNKLVLNWNPGFWYDFLTFKVIEYDRSWGTLEFNLVAEYGTKDLTVQQGGVPGFNIGGGLSYSYTFNDEGEDCGRTYIGYYDIPDQWLEFSSYGVQVLISESDN